MKRQKLVLKCKHLVESVYLSSSCFQDSKCTDDWLRHVFSLPPNSEVLLGSLSLGSPIPEKNYDL